MVDSILYGLINTLPYLAIVCFILLCFKAYLFYSNKTSSWRPQHFFYFSYRHLETSNSLSGKRNKELQNLFSIIILVLLVLAIVGIFLKKEMVYR